MSKLERRAATFGRRALVFSGAHSTGKSTLVSLARSEWITLAGRPPTVVSEVARSVLHRGLPVNRASTLETYLAIVETHVRLDLGAADGMVLLDRFLPDYVGYARVHGNCPSDLMAIAEHAHKMLSELRGYDGVFYLPVEFPTVFDGERDPDPAYQKAVDQAISAILIEWNVVHLRLSGSIERRFRVVHECLTRFQGEKGVS